MTYSTQVRSRVRRGVQTAAAAKATTSNGRARSALRRTTVVTSMASTNEDGRTVDDVDGLWWMTASDGTGDGRRLCRRSGRGGLNKRQEATNVFTADSCLYPLGRRSYNSLGHICFPETPQGNCNGIYLSLSHVACLAASCGLRKRDEA